MPAEPAQGAIQQLLAELDLPRVPQQARSRQKRDALMAAATSLFAERGYDSTTADDIAAAAGVSIGTFYSYFRNKRQLFLTVFADKVEALIALRIGEVDFGDNPRQAIRRILNQAMQQDHLFYRLRRVWQELQLRDPDIAACQQQVNQMVYEQILAGTRRAADASLTWPDLDIEPTCWAITMLLHQNWMSEPEPDEASAERIQRHRDAVADLVYHALFHGHANPE